MPHKTVEARREYQRAYRKQLTNEQRRRYQRSHKTNKAGREVPSRCECCGTKLTRGYAINGVHWDHHHGTGEFRGWLCRGCNLALGQAGDNPAVLRALAAYLERHGAQVTRPLIR